MIKKGTAPADFDASAASSEKSIDVAQIAAWRETKRMRRPAPRLLPLCLLVGVLSGLSAAAVRLVLDFATEERTTHSILLWFLPLAGFAVAWAYQRFAGTASRGTNLILEEIHHPQSITPARMAPMVFISTVVSHLFGASVGREGTIVQMGASFADQIAHRFLGVKAITAAERRALLAAGMGSAFGAAIGTPLAGVIFGMEVVHVGKLRLFALIESLVACLAAYTTLRILGVRDLEFPHFVAPSWDLHAFGAVIVLGAFSGLAARAFIAGVHAIEAFHRKYIPYAPLRPFLGGLLVLVFYFGADMLRYAGLGFWMISDAMEWPAPIAEPFGKGALTALSVGSGFKGGEFVPLVLIGATLGSSLGSLLGVSFQLAARVGFAAVFAGAANTPIACTIMAGELFGWRVLPYVALACAVSFLTSGGRSIYAGQKHEGPKHRLALRALKRIR